MNIQDAVFAWVTSLPAWKQDLFRRAATSPTLSAEDIDAVCKQVLGVAEDPGLGPIQRTEMDGAATEGSTFSIARISNVANVNALANGQVLDFRPRGINVIYGANGTGKTGYSRILKHAGRSLNPEPVLHDVTAKTPAASSAVVAVLVDDEERLVTLSMREAAPPLLARICIHDHKSGSRYVTHQNEIDYVPAALEGMQRFANGLRAVGHRLQEAADRATPAPLDASVYPNGTSARALSDGIDADVDEIAVNALTTLTPDEIAETTTLRSEQGNLLANNVGDLKATATGKAVAVRALRDALTDAFKLLDENAIAQARSERSAYDVSKAAALEAAQFFATEPVAGAGTDKWHVLWQAALAFAAEHNDSLPSDSEPGHCPLCMQELSPAGRKRMGGFASFVSEDVNKRLMDAEAALQSRTAGLPAIDLVKSVHVHALDSLGRDEGNAGHAVLNWLDDAAVLVEQLRDRTKPISAELAPPPMSAIEAGAIAFDAEVSRLIKLEDPSEQLRIKTRLTELEARVLLGERKDEVLNYIAARDRKRKLMAASGEANTQGASLQIGKLTDSFVEDDMRAALREQLRALNFSGLGVKTTTKTKKGQPLIGLAFETVAHRSLDEVLSDGEQRRLALAMCLAEMAVGYEGSPLVLDDPVCSIDQEGRRHIAKQLAQLAADGRQVVIFTHELSFVVELQSAAERAGVEVHAQHLLSIARKPGHVRPSVPWDGLSAKDRSGVLAKNLDGLQQAYEQGQDVYRPAAEEFGNYLRRAYERCVEDNVLGGVVTRRQDAVQTSKLKQVSCDAEIIRMVDRGIGENSRLLHDQALGDGAVPLTPDELSAEYDNFCELLKALGDRSKTRENVRTAERAAQKVRLQKAGIGGTQPALSLTELPSDAAPDKDAPAQTA